MIIGMKYVDSVITDYEEQALAMVSKKKSKVSPKHRNG
jgi:hypothetical protein